ncbi:MAG: FAD-dependent oxidoreductase [Puniceicoccales bacterium]|jgi:phytoene dehydrogenase-like protein|nr:FAD-dependent oxidoreductase [Puniceicoccales bacterium]
MATNHLDNIQGCYDVVVIGSGLAGMTGANCLARLGHRVLLLEHHFQLGGLATSFKRPGGHTFDVSLHGFPNGMIKSCRKYWSREIADSIRQIHDIRFINPEFQLQTTFDRTDFTRILQEHFRVPTTRIEAFFAHLRAMNYYDNDTRTTRDLFEEFFPARPDIHRFLFEPIAYANGSTLDDPAITYGIVFSNFISKGVFIYQGGTDKLVAQMTATMQASGVEIQRNCLAEKILLEPASTHGAPPRLRAIRVKSMRNGATRDIACTAILSNANIKNTVHQLIGTEYLSPAFADEAAAVRVNTSSAQVYLGIRDGYTIPPIGDLVFTSCAKPFSSDELVDLHTTSKTYSVYYPDTRPHTRTPRYAIVASINQRWEDWANLDPENYARHKARLTQEALDGLTRLIPDIRSCVDWQEAATPRTFERYARHWKGASFGTKFEGLKVSMELPNHISGLYHAGSVGIIMSGWLGTINYGVIVASKVDAYLRSPQKKQDIDPALDRTNQTDR